MGDSIRLWHGTASGNNGNILRSIQTQGGLTKAFSRNVFQEPGICFSQSREFCEGHARGSVSLGKSSGIPLLVEIEINKEDISRQWDFDYEFQFETVCTFLENFKEELKAILPLEQPTKIYNHELVCPRIPDSVALDDDTIEDLKHGLVKKMQLMSLDFEREHIHAHVDDVFENKHYIISSQRNSMAHDHSMRALLESACHRLVINYPEKYQLHFRKTMAELAAENEIWGIKYIGEAPLPVRSVTELNI